MDPIPRFRADLARLCDPARERLLVAVSGGPDSLALLLLAHAALGVRCLAATVDHGLRPASRAEAEHVAAICAARGILHAILSAPLPPRSARTANLSARARDLRYALLHAHADATGCDRIATAHHADDQVETLVMRLNRGAGVGGLAGVRAASGRVIRPLLDWRRAELAAITAEARLRAIDDPSNADPRFDRARLRPALAATDWVEVAGWARSAAALGEAEAALDWTTERLLAERRTRSETGQILDLAGLPAELARRLVLACLYELQPGLTPRGDSVTRLLTAAAPMTIGDVLVTPAAGGALAFTHAPPRRSTDE